MSETCKGRFGLTLKVQSGIIFANRADMWRPRFMICPRCDAFVIGEAPQLTFALPVLVVFYVVFLCVPTLAHAMYLTQAKSSEGRKC